MPWSRSKNTMPDGLHQWLFAAIPAKGITKLHHHHHHHQQQQQQTIHQLVITSLSHIKLHRFTTSSRVVFCFSRQPREKSDVCTKVKHHSHQRTVGFEAVGIPQIMCYPMLLLCRYLRDTHFLYTSSASSTNNSRLAYHTAVLWLVISTIMSFDYRFNYKLCIYMYIYNIC